MLSRGDDRVPGRGGRRYDPAGARSREAAPDCAARLDGSRTWSTVLADAGAHEVGPAELARLLHTLAAAGLAELDWPVNRTSVDGQIRLVGADVLGSASASCCCAAVSGCTWSTDRAADGGSAPGPRRSGRRCENSVSVTGIGGDPIRVSSHWTKPETTEVRSRCSPRADSRRTAWRPPTCCAGTLRIWSSGRRSAGPSSGRWSYRVESSCLHCADLTRRDADPAWPGLLAQLGRRTARCRPPWSPGRRASPSPRC